MTSTDGRGLLRGGALLLTLSLIRLGLEVVGPGNEFIPEPSTELSTLLAESRAEMEEEERRSAPLGADERVDPNRADEVELDRLPGIGPVTARAVVAERETSGGFSTPQELLRVRGIGPSTLAKITPHLDFSRSPPLDLYRPGPVRGRNEPSREGRRTNGTSGEQGGASLGGRVDVNTASAEMLQSLPGIGPVLAERILESRQEEGPFRRPEDLLRVKGIGPVVLDRVRPLMVPGGRFP